MAGSRSKEAPRWNPRMKLSINVSLASKSLTKIAVAPKARRNAAKLSSRSTPASGYSRRTTRSTIDVGEFAESARTSATSSRHSRRASARSSASRFLTPTSANAGCRSSSPQRVAHRCLQFDDAFAIVVMASCASARMSSPLASKRSETSCTPTPRAATVAIERRACHRDRPHPR